MPPSPTFRTTWYRPSSTCPEQVRLLRRPPGGVRAGERAARRGGRRDDRRAARRAADPSRVQKRASSDTACRRRDSGSSAHVGRRGARARPTRCCRRSARRPSCRAGARAPPSAPPRVIAPLGSATSFMRSSSRRIAQRSAGSSTCTTSSTYALVMREGDRAHLHGEQSVGEAARRRNAHRPARRARARELRRVRRLHAHRRGRAARAA